MPLVRLPAMAAALASLPVPFAYHPAGLEPAEVPTPAKSYKEQEPLKPLMPPISRRSDVPYVPRRVHVAPVGFEIDRVAEPIIRMRGELAILLANSEAQDVAGTFRSRVQDKLRRARIPTELVRAPIFDFYATTEAILQIFRERRQDGLYFNLSSGSKVQALSGYMAANIARAEGIEVEPYYAEPARYAPTEEEPLSTGFLRAFSIPRLAVRIPGVAPREALKILADGPVPKLALAVQLARLGVLDTKRLDSKGRPRDDASRVSLQTALDSRVIRPLMEWGFVTTERVGKRIRVCLTEEGKLAGRLYPVPD